jgi:hypothetical protein
MWHASPHCAGLFHGEMGDHHSAPFWFSWVRWMHPWKCSHRVHLPHLAKCGNGWQMTALAWDADIIAQYVCSEFYTDHLHQVLRAEMQNILSGDITTFAIYEVLRFYWNTEFTCSLHTHYQWQFPRPHCCTSCIFCLNINDMDSSIYSFVWRSVGLKTSIQ